MPTDDRSILAVRTTARRMGRFRALNARIALNPAIPMGSQPPSPTSLGHRSVILSMPGNQDIRDGLKHT